MKYKIGSALVLIYLLLMTSPILIIGEGETIYYDAIDQDESISHCGSYTDTDDGVRDPVNPETSGDGNYAVCGNNDSHDPIFPDIPTTGLVSVTVVAWFSTGSNSKFVMQLYDGSSNVKTWITQTGLSGAWREFTWETTDVNNPIMIHFTGIRDGGRKLDPSIIHAVYLEVVTV